MADIKLNLAQLSVPDKIDLANTIVADMTRNPTYRTPVPTLAAVTAAATALSTKSMAARSARLASITATSEQDSASTALDDLLTQLASYVQTMSNGDADLIRSAGMDVRATPTKPAPLDAPVITKATPGVKSGVVDLSWTLDLAKTFVVEHTADLTGATGWTNGVDLTRKSGSVPNLAAGTRYLFRVAGVNSLGKGPWSQTVEQVAAL